MMIPTWPVFLRLHFKLSSWCFFCDHKLCKFFCIRVIRIVTMSRCWIDCIKFLIRFLEFLETSFWLIYFCALNITFTPVNFKKKKKKQLLWFLNLYKKIIENVNMLLQKSEIIFLPILKNEDLSFRLKKRLG